MNSLYVVKIGGNIIDDETKLLSFISDFAQISGLKILVHGGGKVATQLAEKMNLKQTLVEGRRITDAATLDIVTMVYSGLINKNIVAKLQSKQCNALGICGVDGNLVQSHKRTGANIDYGFVGDVDLINSALLSLLLSQGYIPVVAPITHDKNGQLLNTNADTIAQEIAVSLAAEYETTLIYSFEKEGVLLDIDDDNSTIKKLDKTYYEQLKSENKIFAGMVPKLDNAFKAVDLGLKHVIIGNAEKLGLLVIGENGTTIG